MAHETHDEGFHEIHLSGKQLIFLFMATTVVSVVIFLFGVLVGRGAQPAGSSLPFTAGSASPDGVTLADGERPDAEEATALLEEAPELAAEDLSYDARLRSNGEPSEALTSAPPEPEPRPTERAPAPEREPAPAPAEPEPDPDPEPVEPIVEEAPPAPPEPAPAAVASSPASAPEPEAPEAPAAPTRAATAPASLVGDGFRVQVVALRDRDEATQIVQSLRARGYDAYLVDPVPQDRTQVYRVRVGNFPDRADAEEVRLRLEREEQFSPWITR